MPNGVLIEPEYVDRQQWKDFKLPEVNQIPENAKLMFNTSSDFPRHKLKITKYQRKIKENLADFLVGNYNNQITYINFRNAFITDDIIYVTHSVNLEQFKKEYFQYEDIQHVENYILYYFNPEQLLYYEYVIGKHKIPLITDKNLNKLVDKNNDILTQNDIDSISELMESNDKDNIVLATKLFTQFNLNETPCLTRMILAKYGSRMKQSSAGTSVVFKNVINQFGLHDMSRYFVINCLKSNPPTTKEETLLVRKIVLDYFGHLLTDSIEGLSEIYEGIGLKIECNVKECLE